MPDVFTKEKRSQVMAAIRSRGNKATELKLASILRAAGITGWRRHQPMSGRPDFVFRTARFVVFVDGCFWHGCPDHHTVAATNEAFWAEKVQSNRARDRDTDRRLADAGWISLRVWEHEDPGEAAGRIRTAVAARRP